MTAYRRAYISTCEAFGWEGGPGYQTNIVTIANKHENANANWDQPQHFFSVPFMNILPAMYAPIKQMHMNCRGRWGRFLYRDRLDCTVNDELLAIALPGQDTFQLGKWSVIDGVEYFRHVYAILEPAANGRDALEVTPVITVDGTPTTAFSVNHDRGIVVFDTPMSGDEELRWSASTFSLWVRFDNDRMPMSIDNKTGGGEFVINGSIELLEMQPPKPEPSS